MMIVEDPDATGTGAGGEKSGDVEQGGVGDAGTAASRAAGLEEPDAATFGVLDPLFDGVLDPKAAPEPDLPLTEEEVGYVRASRARNTLRGYRADWASFTRWCRHAGIAPLPASPGAVSHYLVALARDGKKVSTISRHLSSIRFAHQLHDLPDPTSPARVVTVWEGIRRKRGTPPRKAAALTPPELFEVVQACATTRCWKTRDEEVDLAGLRDRALLLVGFFGALRRSEIAGLTVPQIRDDPRGLVLRYERSKTNQRGEHLELVVLPRASAPSRCPVLALRTWLAAADLHDGPVFRKVSTGNRVLERPLHPETVNNLVRAAVARAGLEKPETFSGHSLRAGFVTYAHQRGASDRAIAHQTRHRSLASVGDYLRWDSAWEDNAATQLGL